MTDPTAPPLSTSIIVVSRGRSDLLKLCLLSLSQQDHPNYEIIVVADPAGCATAQAMPWAERLKIVEFDAANISAARNLGLMQAAGDIVAFIDDDAAAEPTWALRLTHPFRDPTIAAAAGFVRGRNGISYQWQASSVDHMGQETALAVPDTLSTHRAEPGKAIKTPGTNCAFRRSELLTMGGFDPGYHFFFDETDLNMRLARLHAVTAIVPDAEVHHAFAKSAHRSAQRAPLDLYEIGASCALFLERHCPAEERAEGLRRLRDDRRTTVIRHLVAGTLEPRDMRHLMARFDAGAREGAKRAQPLTPLDGTAPPPLLRFGQAPRQHDTQVFSGWSWQSHRLISAAQAAAHRGTVATVMLFSPTCLYHREAFVAPGLWEQRGGLFGKSLRDDPVWRFYSVSGRARRERDRTARVRSVEAARASVAAVQK